MRAIWEGWGTRFKELAKKADPGFSLARLSDTLVSLEEQKKLGSRERKGGRQWGESGLRHWTNGTRPINLEDFFIICKVAGVDPALVLFNAPVMTEALKDKLSETVRTVLEADPATNPNHKKLSRNLREKAKA